MTAGLDGGGAGRCLCGAVRYEFDGAPDWQGLCHCESCRRATSAPVAAFLCVPDDRLRWSGAAPAEFASSPGVTRFFCPRCGSQMAYRTAKRPGVTDLYAASLADPAAYRPTFHVFWSERLTWLAPGDDLKKIERGG